MEKLNIVSDSLNCTKSKGTIYRLRDINSVNSYPKIK